MKKKILIIVWKWQMLKAVNENSYSIEELDAFVKDIGKGEGTFYKTYAVDEAPKEPEGLVIAINIYKDRTKSQTKPLLESIITKYNSKDCEMILMLHQAHGYDANDVGYYKDIASIRNCFLFTGEHDYIYYNAQQEGLLDGEGNFYLGFHPDKKEKVKVLIKDEKSGAEFIHRKYFNRTWTHYTLEPEIKILHLKEEFFDAIFPLYQKTDGVVLIKKELLNALDFVTNRCLFPRIKSFIGGYKNLETMDTENYFEEYDKLKAEKDQIKSLERRDKISYDFDDCIPYFEDTKQQLINDSYQRCKRTFEDILNTESSTEIDKFDLQELANELSFMVKIVPGEIN
jgi:hypothetical protein